MKELTQPWFCATYRWKGKCSVDEKHPYRAYLLRLWPAQEAGQIVWRASLESPHTGERLGFRTLQRLFVFLEDQTTHQSGSMEPALRTE